MSLQSKTKRGEITGAALALASGVMLCVWGRSGSAESPPPAPPPAVAAPTPTPAPVADGGVAPTPGPPSDTVRIIFYTVPSSKATVSWGRKRLGLIAPKRPLVIQRPRDSGPLDLMVRSDGYLPVQTRVYTFNDGKYAVRLTPLDQKKTLLGYREPPPPDGGIAPASPDGGAIVTPSMTPDAGPTL